MDNDDAAEEVEVPEFILPLFFTSKTQEIFQCKSDEDVTEESPYKIISKGQILQDFRDRAAISDFHPVKKIVENYPADELLVVYDPLFKYGQNFYLITDEGQKQIILNPPEQSPDNESGLLGGEDAVEIRFGLSTPKPWTSLGSEQDVEDEMVLNTRGKVTFTISRERQFFGAPVMFDDRDEEVARDIVIGCLSYNDDSYTIQKRELDKGIQKEQQLNLLGAKHFLTMYNYPED